MTDFHTPTCAGTPTNAGSINRTSFWCLAAPIFLLLAFPEGGRLFAAAPKFDKVSDHCYVLQEAENGVNTGAVVTEDGVLLINPPARPELTTTTDALRRLTPKAVRWILGTDYRLAKAGEAYWSMEPAAILLGSQKLLQLMSPVPASGSKEQSPPHPEAKEQKPSEAREAKPAELKTEPSSPPRFLFGNQMHLFPSGVEVRIFAVQQKACTAADLAAFVPAERVIFVGNLFNPGNYPQIDTASGDGSALGWLNGLRQVIDAVPLLKSAMPQPKVEAKVGEEKTLEELITVIPAHGPRSNLKEVKSLLEISNKLRSEIARAVSLERDLDWFLNSPASSPFRAYGNLESFAGQLFTELANK